jgi:AraC-like DNA-binding protein
VIEEGPVTSMSSIDLHNVESAFDTLNDIAFFVKDVEGRYVSVNWTMVKRCGARAKRDILGRTVMDLFPRVLAETYMAQDQKVIETSLPLMKHLELHMYPGRHKGWCITHKFPMLDTDNVPVGLIGTSQDLGVQDDVYPAYRQIAHIAEYIHSHYHENISLAELAASAGMSISRVERLFQKVFHYSPRQLLVQCRLSAARSLIESEPEKKIADVAYDCGYTDHSAFSRQFKSTFGMSPTEYGLLVKTR